MVKAQMEQRGRELDSWEQLIEKAIEAEAKAGLQHSFIFQEMDQHCPRGNRPAHTTVAKSQASVSSVRDPQTEPSTEKALAPDKSPHSSRFEHDKTSDKKAQKEMKKNSVAEMLSKLAKTPPQPLVFTRPAPPPAELLPVAKIPP